MVDKKESGKSRREVEMPAKKVSGKTKKKYDASAEMPSMEEMLKAGSHFGHRTSRWNAKMAPYIFTTRNNVHILDLEKTHPMLKEALEYLRGIKDKKGVILFVGTKVAAKDITKETAQKLKMPYATERWIGGTITNFGAISKRLEYYRDLENKKESGELKKYTKKEQHDFNVEMEKMSGPFGGLKSLAKVPDALFVVDTNKEKLAVKEANMKSIPVVGLCDTNADPSLVTYPIPVNDDAISSLKVVMGAVQKVLK